MVQPPQVGGFPSIVGVSTYSASKSGKEHLPSGRPAERCVAKTGIYALVPVADPRAARSPECGLTVAGPSRTMFCLESHRNSFILIREP